MTSTGVQPAAMDQPQINLVIHRNAHGEPLVGKSAEGDAFNVEAFLDTGASSICLSVHTAQMLGIHREMIARDEARFQDVGVGGGSEFAVSQPLYVSLAPMAPNVDVEQKDAIATTYFTTYLLTMGPNRAEIGPLNSEADFLTSLALGIWTLWGCR